MKSLPVVAAVGVLAFSGCQTYQAIPLDLDQHKQDWAERDPSSPEVVEYAQSLLSQDEGAVYDPSDGLSLHEAEVVALLFNPDLRVARLEAKVPLASAKYAGLMEDPELSFDLQRIAESVDEPWILGIGIGFTIPISGRLGAQEDQALARYDIALEMVRNDEWKHVLKLRQMWANWSAIVEEEQLIRDYLLDLEAANQVAERLRESGELGNSEARIFLLEIGHARGAQADALAKRQQYETQIKSMLGLTPDAALLLSPSLAGETIDSSEAAQREALEIANPRLSAKRAEYALAEQTLKLEITKQYPDLTIGPAIGNEDGQSRIGFGLGFPIPSINLNKGGIAEAKAAREAAGARFYAEYNTLIAELKTAHQVLTAASAKRQYLVEEIAPMVDRQVAELRETARLGELDALLQLDALGQRSQTKLQILEARLAEVSALFELHALLGPRNVRGTPTEGDHNE